MWALLQSAPLWSGGGLGPVRLDRAQILARMPDTPRWILDPLLDAYELAAVAAIAVRRARDRKPGAAGRPTRASPEEIEDDG